MCLVYKSNKKQAYNRLLDEMLIIRVRASVANSIYQLKLKRVIKIGLIYT